MTNTDPAPINLTPGLSTVAELVGRMSLVTLHHGDALDVMRTLPDESVDAVVTDPPYELGFMGRAWDASGIAYNVEIWKQCARVLKPGGHLLVFGGTRTYHRMACAIEDAGLELRDSISWLYGSGFPKSLDVSKAIDKAAGATDDAKRWQGWGTALKPAHEPIVVARKPLAGTVAANVLTHGTGALNIDGCRVAATGNEVYGDGLHGSRAVGTTDTGRWPTNVVMSHPPLLDDTGAVVGDACADGCVEGCPVAELDQQSGVLKAGAFPATRGADRDRTAYGEFAGQSNLESRRMNSGGASRFFPVFRYQAKAPASERPKVDGIAHPTVKPLDLMRWLVRLVTPPGGVVLDPFAGSGTTAEACITEGARCITIEREAQYVPLVQARIDRARRTALE